VPVLPYQRPRFCSVVITLRVMNSKLHHAERDDYSLAAASEGLAFLAAHLFVFVTDAFTLVRLRLA
jgi:hypothetical protein